jgi:hypothetical protein
MEYIARMTDALQKLIEAAKTANPTPEQREQQRRSFVYGNTHFENERITREMVDREAEKLAREKKRRMRSVNDEIVARSNRN